MKPSARAKATRAADYVVEIDRHDGSELARIEIGGPIASSVLSDDQRQLYVIAEQDGDITAIDFETMQIRKLELPLHGPWPGVIPFGPLAMMSLSADGRQLYQIGFDVLLCDPEASFDENCRPRAIGLRIVDLETNAVLYEDLEANQLTRSPDGRWIITTSRILGEFGTGTQHGLKIIDAARLEVVVHLEPDTAFRSIAIAADSRHAYALGDIKPAGIAPNPDCTQECATVFVIDLERLAIVAKHVYDEPVLALQSVP